MRWTRAATLTTLMLLPLSAWGQSIPFEEVAKGDISGQERALRLVVETEAQLQSEVLFHVLDRKPDFAAERVLAVMAGSAGSTWGDSIEISDVRIERSGGGERVVATVAIVRAEPNATFASITVNPYHMVAIPRGQVGSLPVVFRAGGAEAQAFDSLTLVTTDPAAFPREIELTVKASDRRVALARRDPSTLIPEFFTELDAKDLRELRTAVEEARMGSAGASVPMGKHALTVDSPRAALAGSRSLNTDTPGSHRRLLTALVALQESLLRRAPKAKVWHGTVEVRGFEGFRTVHLVRSGRPEIQAEGSFAHGLIPLNGHEVTVHGPLEERDGELFLAADELIEPRRGEATGKVTLSDGRVVLTTPSFLGEDRVEAAGSLAKSFLPLAAGQELTVAGWTWSYSDGQPWKVLVDRVNVTWNMPVGGGTRKAPVVVLRHFPALGGALIEIDGAFRSTVAVADIAEVKLSDANGIAGSLGQ